MERKNMKTGGEAIPVNIRQTLALAASIIRGMSGRRLDKNEMNGLIDSVQRIYGECKNEGKS